MYINTLPQINNEDRKAITADNSYQNLKRSLDKRHIKDHTEN
jgi:hypothetical protein